MKQPPVTPARLLVGDHRLNGRGMIVLRALNRALASALGVTQDLGWDMPSFSLPTSSDQSGCWAPGRKRL